MLVLSRRINQTIQIGDDITITVTEIRGDKVRLGIDAPIYVPIIRDDALNDASKHQPSAYALGHVRELKLYAALKNLYDDKAAGELDSESMLAADELIRELEILA